MTLTDINVESKTSASEHICVFRVFRGQKKRETDLSDFYDFQCHDNIKEPYNLTAVRLSKLKQPIKEIDCLLSFLRPLSVLRTSLTFLFDIPRKGQEAGAERPFANLSALLPSPSRGKGRG